MISVVEPGFGADFTVLPSLPVTGDPQSTIFPTNQIVLPKCHDHFTHDLPAGLDGAAAW